MKVDVGCCVPPETEESLFLFLKLWFAYEVAGAEYAIAMRA
jgi:hypothetical protein